MRVPQARRAVAWGALMLIAACQSTAQLQPHEKSPRPPPEGGTEVCGGSDLERRVRRALTQAEAHEPHSAQVAEILTDLAAVCRSEGRIDLAIGMVNRAVLVWEVSAGGDHPELAKALVYLGELQREAGDAAGAERAYLRAMTLSAERLGQHHANVGTCALGLGSLYYRQGRLDEAAAMYTRAVEVATAAEGDAGRSGIDAGLALRNLAMVQRRLGKTAAARATLQRALAVFEERLPNDDPNVINLRSEIDELGP